MRVAGSCWVRGGCWGGKGDQGRKDGGSRGGGGREGGMSDGVHFHSFVARGRGDHVSLDVSVFLWLNASVLIWSSTSRQTALFQVAPF